jgi:hypothetical protein
MQAENAKNVRGFEGGWWVLRDLSVVAHFPLYSSPLSIIVRKKMSFIKQRWDVLLIVITLKMLLLLLLIS